MYQRIRKAFQWRWRAIQARLAFYWVLYASSLPLRLPTQRAVIFAPHQDDETLGCGGLIALKGSQNIPVWIVFLTDGAVSYQYDPHSDPAGLSQIRRREAMAALSILGVDPLKVYFLDHPDGELLTLCPDRHQFLIEQLIQILHQAQPQEIYLPHFLDGHPDHEATWNLVQEALIGNHQRVNIWQYPIWLFWQGRYEFSLNAKKNAQCYRLDIRTVQTQKEQAIAAYPSQHAILPRPYMHQFTQPYELFFPVTIPPYPSDKICE